MNIRIYLAVYGPEIIGFFGLDEKRSCGLGRTNYVRPPIIGPHSHVVCGKDADKVENPGGLGEYGANVEKGRVWNTQIY